MYNFTFNNEKKEWLYLLDDFERQPFASINRSLINVTGMSGAHLSSTTLEPLLINVPVGFKFKDAEEGMKLKEEMASWLFTHEPVPLQFDDEPNRTYYAVVQNTMDDIAEFIRFKRGTIEFICLDPYKYGPEKTEEYKDDSFVVENEGTAEAEPTFELTAKEKTTFAMIANGTDEDSAYNIIGVPTEVDEEVVDRERVVLTERGESLSTWDTPGAKIDDGKVDGELGTDGTGIHPLSYGSPASDKGWYGPAVMKEIETIQDFEVEMRLRADTNKPKQMYRIEFYLYDENMNVLGKMAIRDYALHNDRYAAEGRVGEDIRRRDYQISRHNYLRERDHFHGLVRMRRIGQKYELYVARLKTGSNDQGKHHDRFQVDYMDIDDEYQGRLKYVQINILRHKEGTSGNVPRINSIKVKELKEVTEDQTPYIIYAGDLVTFDHKDEDVLINGEPLNELKNFGGTFFPLYKGYNTIITYPDGAFDTNVTLRDKYL